MKIGHLQPEESSEFVRAWMGPGDPTGLLTRRDPEAKPYVPEPEDVEEPRELVLARESTEKE